MNTRKILAGEVFELLLRNWWALAVGTALGVVAGLCVLHFVPHRYEAQARVDTFEGDFPSELVRTSLSTERLAFLETLRSSVLRSGEILPKLAERLPRDGVDLDLSQLPKEARDRWLKSITILTNPRGRFIEIYVRNEDPRIAASLANVVADLFVEKNAEVRARLAGDVTATLRQLVEQTGEDLQEKEHELALMKRKYPYQTEQQRPANQQIISSLRRDLSAVLDSQAQMEMQIETLEAEKMQAELLADDIFGQSLVDPATAKEARLADLERELKQLRLRYAEEHPDVQAKIREIEDYKASIASQPSGGSTSPETRGASGGDIWTPQILAAQREMTRLKAQEKEIRENIARYQQYLNETPRVQAEMDRLERDVQALQRKYSELKSREEAARAAQRIEETKSWSQLEVAKYAVPPAFPAVPNPFITFALSWGLGLAVILGPLIVRQVLKPRILSLARLQAASRIPVLASIPVLETPGVRRERTVRRLRNTVSVLLSAAAVLGTAYLTGVMP